jgi:hypothetical protein
MMGEAPHAGLPGDLHAELERTAMIHVRADKAGHLIIAAFGTAKPAKGRDRVPF